VSAVSAHTADTTVVSAVSATTRHDRRVPKPLPIFIVGLTMLGNILYRHVMLEVWSCYYGRPRAVHYIFMLFLLSSFFFFSSPNLSGRRLDAYHTSAHGVALVRI